MIKVFVDESGNMGAEGKYFVLAAVVVKNKETEVKLRRIVRKEQLLDTKGRKLKLSQKREELKFSRMKFQQRQRVLNKIAGKSGVEMFYFVAYKPMVMLLNMGKDKNLTYNYFSRLLMEKVLRRYEDDFEIVFDQRTTAVKTMNSLTRYIRISAYKEFPKLKGKKIMVNQADSRTNYMLQVADVIAGAAGQAYAKRNLHFLEIIGREIQGIREFPKRGFVGSRKNEIGRAEAIRKFEQGIELKN